MAEKGSMAGKTSVGWRRPSTGHDMLFIWAALQAGLALAVKVQVSGTVGEYCGSEVVEQMALLHQLSPEMAWSAIDGLAERVKLSLPDHLSGMIKTTQGSRDAASVAGIYEDIYARLPEATVPKGRPECKSWLQYGEKVLCDATKLPSLMERLKEGRLKGCKASDLALGFDHYLSRDLTAFPVVILWADPSDPDSWSPLHKELAKQARIGDITYILRWIIKRNGCSLPSEQITLSGYGVNFEVKGEEGQSLTVKKNKECEGIFNALPGTASELSIVIGLPSGDLEDLGLQVIKLVTAAKDPLGTFRTIVNNFPLLAQSIAKSGKAGDAMLEKIHQIQRRFQLFPQIELMAVNGIMIEAAAFSLAGLRSFACRYKALYEHVKEKASFNQAERVLRVGIARENPTFDVRSSAIVWLNDLENDAAYESEPKQLRSILRYSNSGFFGIGRNLVNVVLFLDPTWPEAAKVLRAIRTNWIDKAAPMRIGLVLANGAERDETAVLIRSFYGVIEAQGQTEALDFLQKYLDIMDDEEEDDRMQRVYKTTVGGSKKVEDLADDSVARDLAQQNKDLVARMMVTRPVAFINGRVKYLSTSIGADLMEGYKAEIGELQQLVFRGDLKDASENLLDDLMDIRQAYKHRHPRLFDSGSITALLDPTRLPAKALKEIFEVKRYIYPRKHERKSKGYKGTAVTLWLVVDANRRHEIDLVNAALTFMSQTEQPVRLYLLLANPIDRHLKAVMISYRELLKGHFSLEKYAAYLEKSVNNLRPGATEHLKRPGEHGRPADYEIALEMREHVQALMLACGVGPVYKDPMLFVNGKLRVTLRREDEPLSPDHFEALVQQELVKTSLLLQATGVKLDAADTYADYMVLGTAFQQQSLAAIQKHFGTGQKDIGAFPVQVPDLPTFKVRGDGQSLVHLTAIIDPLCLAAQRYASIVSEAASESWLSGQTWFNPALKLAHFPLLTFYRFTSGSGPVTLDFGQEVKGLKLAAQLDAPMAWDALMDEGSLDPDNLTMASSDDPFNDSEQLVRMKLRGLVTEIKFDSPLGRNLGGLNAIAKDALTGVVIEQVPLMGDVNIAQFAKLGHRLYYVELEKEAGKHFAITESQLGFHLGYGRNLGYISLNPLGALPKSLAMLSPSVQTEQAKINIFSIASGAMYERLIRIMMTSVMKRGKRSDTVKFWLIETFVSPAFKASVQTMSAHYGFQYEWVHARWPSWLRRQQRKHRTVWAYKVLFLDQIFPASLDRIIYIDADQVVRGDLTELVGTELRGDAPWAFVPFCDSRKESEQYRFWKQGYWKTVLEGRPYHISAIFLLDLPRLRTTGLGDRLRRDYHMLSVDPNSLANLDQDLPNHMQDDHPIHSLPQEWLWCETWCSDDSKPKAKSIDLCNDPGRKESKLEQGARIISEWKEYDHEVDFILKANTGNSAKRTKSDL